MSWPLASFLIVAVVLGVGWIAYERTRPSARMAAVVAVMAALAALGRDAFAALPDVKPITAMTLAVGYALGPLPGFTVGALGMLVSNFVLGQGPYTPWQMAAWGMVGLFGAALGRMSGRRLGRVALALACAAAALGAKEVMNLYTWTLGATHTPAAFLAVAGQALAYDITDVVASFLFGLAFAPELARVLGRMRVRMHVRWEHPLGSPAQRVGLAGPPVGRASWTQLLLPLLLAGGALALAGPRSSAAGVASTREVSFLASAQNADGGFGAGRGQASTELYSSWAAMGLAAAGRDPLTLRRAGNSVFDALRREASTLRGAGDLERTILALHACGVPLRSLPGGDPVARLSRLQTADGSFDHLTNLTAFGVLALRAAGYGAGNPALSHAAGWLVRQQEADGGFGFAQRGGGSDVDDTAAVVQAIAQTRAGSRAARSRASAFLVRAQNPDGGFPQQRGGTSNAQSTAWAIEGMLAAGRDPARVTRGGSRSPLGYLESLVAPDGSVRYSRTGSQTPVWVTAQALTALARRSLPIQPVRRMEARRASAPSRAHPRHGVTSSHPGAHGGAARAQTEAARAGERQVEGLGRGVGLLLGVILAPRGG